MALISYCGVPGSGKTLHCTYEALKHYKRQNSRLKRFLAYSLYKLKINKDLYLYYCNFPNKKINNVYSTYPILLDRKNNIYTNKCTLYDLDNSKSFLPDSLIIIDEVQLFIDSDEYVDKLTLVKLRKIGRFLQAHRHYGIKNIIFTSQHPSRIFKKGRNVSESYFKHKKVRNIPFIPISLFSGIGYYEQDFYGRFIPKDKEERKKLPFDYYKQFKFFNRNKVYNSYDSRYLAKYNFDKPLINRGLYMTSIIDLEYLKVLFDTE